jgi:hypothetical protein
MVWCNRSKGSLVYTLVALLIFFRNMSVQTSVSGIFVKFINQARMKSCPLYFNNLKEGDSVEVLIKWKLLINFRLIDFGNKSQAASAV